MLIKAHRRELDHELQISCCWCGDDEAFSADLHNQMPIPLCRACLLHRLPPLIARAAVDMARGPEALSFLQEFVDDFKQLIWQEMCDCEGNLLPEFRAESEVEEGP
jgi:hypothetical protein